MQSMPQAVSIGQAVSRALKTGEPVVALESALITHGLPYPKNLEVARELEAAVRSEGAIPATIGVLGGLVHVGLDAAELEEIARSRDAVKVSRRDIARAMISKRCGGTTVAATMFLAWQQSIDVLATGGIGGVHRESPYDISADLPTLAETPMIVVCAGAKAILDLPATLEYLETAGVPVAGYGVDEFPAFYSRESGLQASLRLDSPDEVAEQWKAQRELGLPGALLIANPIPEANAIPRRTIEPIIEQASAEAVLQGVRAQAVTPFLLRRVSELTGLKSIAANEALLLNNARLAAQIAAAVKKIDQQQEAKP